MEKLFKDKLQAIIYLYLPGTIFLGVILFGVLLSVVPEIDRLLNISTIESDYFYFDILIVRILPLVILGLLFIVRLLEIRRLRWMKEHYLTSHKEVHDYLAHQASKRIHRFSSLKWRKACVLYREAVKLLEHKQFPTSN